MKRKTRDKCQHYERLCCFSTTHFGLRCIYGVNHDITGCKFSEVK